MSLLYAEHQKLLNSDNRLKSSIDRSNSFIRPYLLQTLQGLKFDLKVRETLLNDHLVYQDQMRRICKILAGYEFNLGSWQQLSKYLYEYKKLKKPEKDLTASHTLYKLLTKHNVPLLKAILKYRSSQKDSGFLEFQPWNNDRINTAVKIAGPDTYRISSSKLFKFWGTNLQNIRKHNRQIIIADEGKFLVQTDQSGAEAYVNSYLCRNGNYRAIFEHGIKIHSFVAMHIFSGIWCNKLGISLREYEEQFLNVPIPHLPKNQLWKSQLEPLIKSSDDWPPSERYYYIAKMVRHARAYGAGANALQMNILKKSEGTIVITKQQAEYFIEVDNHLFPELLDWQTSIREQLSKDRTLYNLFGDRRIFFGNFDETLFKSAYSFIPQSTVGVLTSVAIAELQQRLDNRNDILTEAGYDVLANGHDAILGQCKMGYEKVIAKEQEQALAKTFNTRYGEFTMKSESSYGQDWYHLKKI
jgi:DNA polymerase I-like protein with 3'-5' exonuclease and polymerase domains